MISVIIPVYNVEEYLHVCINSILKQTYQNFEIICIDNASSDSSLEILEYFSQKDSRIKIIKNESNMAWGYCKNQGIEAATGKYVLFLGGDDWYSLDALEILHKNIEKDNLDVLLFKNIIYNQETHNFEFNFYQDMSFMKKFNSKIFNHMSLEKTDLFNIPDGYNKLYLKSFLEDNHIRFVNENFFNENTHFSFNVLLHAEKISLVDEYLYNMRYREESRITFNNTLFDNIDIIYLILEIFLEDIKIYEYYKKELLNFIFVDVLNKKYHQIDDCYKDRFYIEIQVIYKNFVKKYGLYQDIHEIISDEILNFFKFEDIVQDLIINNPKVSIILPVYNVEKYLPKCLDSICNQTFNDFEIICINDGSTDSSLNILKFYSKKDNRIKIINQENCGLGSARNIGLKYSNGDYILFIDSDDYISEKEVELLYENLISNNSDLVIFKIARFVEEENIIYDHPGFDFDNIFKNVDFDNFTFDYHDIKQYVMNASFAPWTKLYKKEFLNKFNLKFPVATAFEDVIFHVKCLLNASKISFVPEFLYYYRLSNENSILHDKSNSKDILNVCGSVKQYLKYSGHFNEFKLEFIIFKLRQLSQYVTSDESDEYFDLVKKEFEKMDLRAFEKDIPQDLMNIYNKIVLE